MALGMNEFLHCACSSQFIHFLHFATHTCEWPAESPTKEEIFLHSIKVFLFLITHAPIPYLKKSFLLHKIAHVIVSQMYFRKYGSHRSWGIVLLSSFEMRCAIRLRSVETSFGWRSPSPQKHCRPLPLRPYGTPENAENADQVAQSNNVGFNWTSV